MIAAVIANPRIPIFLDDRNAKYMAESTPPHKINRKYSIEKAYVCIKRKKATVEALKSNEI